MAEWFYSCILSEIKSFALIQPNIMHIVGAVTHVFSVCFDTQSISKKDQYYSNPFNMIYHQNTILSRCFEGKFREIPSQLEWLLYQQFWLFSALISIGYIKCVLSSLIRNHKNNRSIHLNAPPLGNIMPLHSITISPLKEKIKKVLRSPIIPMQKSCLHWAFNWKIHFSLITFAYSHETEFFIHFSTDSSALLSWSTDFHKYGGIFLQGKKRISL